ncbi:MAG: nicotinamide riboside transporter PnuC [Flavobacteriales bacterium]|nr:nicotinamide riboside transporter PnuC [Flavobacteriales bacterium]
MNEAIQILHTITSQVSLIEFLAVSFSIIYVILAANGNIWCWLAAIISVSLYVYICYNAKLYAETILQVFYLLMAFWGYFSWKSMNTKNTIQEITLSSHILFICFGVVFTFISGYLFSIYSDAKMPLVDSFTTIFSLIATYMVVKRILSTWLYFIVIDIVSIYLYYSRDLYFSSILFIIYSIIAVIGYYNWTKILVNND